MKKIRRMMALVIAMVMTLAMVLPAMAASIELKQEPQDFADSHTYN